MKILTVILLLTSTTAFGLSNYQPVTRDLAGREKIVLDRGQQTPVYTDLGGKEISNGHIDIYGNY